MRRLELRSSLSSTSATLAITALVQRYLLLVATGIALNAGSAHAHLLDALRAAPNRLVGEQTTKLEYWRALAAENSVRAQYVLGLMYEAGDEAPLDLAQARKWHQLAATQGFAEAQFRLGLLLGNSKAAGVDFVQAMKWLSAAANQGHAQAQITVAIAYERAFWFSPNYGCH